MKPLSILDKETFPESLLQFYNNNSLGPTHITENGNDLRPLWSFSTVNYGLMIAALRHLFVRSNARFYLRNILIHFWPYIAKSALLIAHLLDTLNIY